MVHLSKLAATVAVCVLPALVEAQWTWFLPQAPGRGPPPPGPPGRGPPARGPPPPGPPQPGPPQPGPPPPGPPQPGPPGWGPNPMPGPLGWGPNPVPVPVPAPASQPLASPVPSSNQDSLASPVPSSNQVSLASPVPSSNQVSLASPVPSSNQVSLASPVSSSNQVSIQPTPTSAVQRPITTTTTPRPSVAAVSSSTSRKQAQVSPSPSGPYAITGLKTGIDSSSGQRPLRQNINDLQASGAQWDLYILGLAAMQRDTSENDMLSYFQISGIHGRPNIPWNGVQAVPGGSGGGYCPHGMVQFPMWHRPYVALFEQVLGSHIQAIAANYSGSRAQEYRTAADNWRHPYWDWAADGGAQLPTIATQTTITVNGPGGKVTMANPLLGYKWQSFPLNTASNYFPTSGDRNCWGFPETTRWPDANGNNRPSLANSQLSQDDLKANTYNVFTTATDYETMASTESNGNSFEDVHNSVHAAIYAVMAYIEYSAFDPLFMLHHTNVDRLIAMWQAIHYNDKTQTQTLPSGALFATAANTPITADSPLKPFYRDTAGNFHTGRTASEIKSFGYSYPEIIDWNQSQDALARQVTVSVNRLYGPSGTSSKRKVRRNHRRSSCISRKDQVGSYSSPAASQPDAPHKMYSAMVDLQRSELPLPCSVSVYVEGEFAGKISVMSMPASGMMHSVVSLNTALEKLGKSMAIPEPQGNNSSSTTGSTTAQKPAISSGDKEIIQKQLSVVIQSINGTIVPVSSAPSLKIKVELQHVAPPKSEDSLPIITPITAGPLAKPVDHSA